MHQILAQIAQLQDQARLQASTIQAQASSLQLVSVQLDELSSTVQAQAASIACLASENEELRRVVEDQDQFMGELSRASEGFWIWESAREGRKEGRWVYSLEKYRSSPLTVAPHAGPPTSFDSLPNELLDFITFLLPQSDQLSLGRCSYRLLVSVSYQVYGFELVLDSEDATEFVFAGLSQAFAYSDRIRSLLLPSKLVLTRRGLSLHRRLELLDDLPHRHPLLYLKALVLDIDDYSTIVTWSPLLRLLNPRAFQISGRNKHRHASPRVFVKEELAFSFHGRDSSPSERSELSPSPSSKRTKNSPSDFQSVFCEGKVQRQRR